jgi:hypothetical protein
MDHRRHIDSACAACRAAIKRIEFASLSIQLRCDYRPLRIADAPAANVACEN